MTAEKIVSLCVRVLEDRKAVGTVVLDMRGLSPFTDYFVICTATSFVHGRALEERLRAEAKKAGVRARNPREGRESRWLLVDFDDAIVHIFEKSARDYYALENLWGDAPVPYDARK